jgi:hypothetical protein
MVVQPDTVIRWHRDWLRRRWTRRSRCRPDGRPPIDQQICALVREMVTANPLWGAPWVDGFFTVPTLTGRVLFVVIVLSHVRRRIVHFKHHGASNELTSGTFLMSFDRIKDRALTVHPHGPTLRFEWKRAYLFCAYDYRVQEGR